MKRRKGKRKPKPKQDAKPVAPLADQVIVSGELNTDAVEIVEVQDEIENLGSSYAPRQEPEARVEQAVAPSPSAKEEGIPQPTPQSGADRRAHPRYTFKAAIEVVSAVPVTRLKTRVRDLSQQGCYVDTDTPLALGTITEIRISRNTESLEARARVVFKQPGRGMGLMFTEVQPEQSVILDAWLTESRETSWLAVNRRRSQRVLMRLPVRVSGQVGPDSPIEEETHTVAISAHGAMITLAAPVYRGQRFTLLNVQTKESLECDVVHIDKNTGQQVQVGLEFLLPNSAFWRVAFPPKDWTPRHPDAKSK